MDCVGGWHAGHTLLPLDWKPQLCAAFFQTSLKPAFIFLSYPTHQEPQMEGTMEKATWWLLWGTRENGHSRTSRLLECCFMGRRKQSGELQDRKPSVPAGSHGLCSFAALCCRAQHNSPEMVKQLQFEMKAGAASPGTWGGARRQQRGGGRWSRCPVPWEMVFVKDNSPWWKSRQGYQENRTLFWKVETH